MCLKNKQKRKPKTQECLNYKISLLISRRDFTVLLISLSFERNHAASQNDWEFWFITWPTSKYKSVVIFSVSWGLTGIKQKEAAATLKYWVCCFTSGYFVFSQYVMQLHLIIWSKCYVCNTCVAYCSTLVEISNNLIIYLPKALAKKCGKKQVSSRWTSKTMRTLH